MTHEELIKICNIINSESNKYNKNKHHLYLKHKTDIDEFTKDLVPDEMPPTKRIDYIVELEKDPELRFRYFGECNNCNIRFKRIKGKNSSICLECKTSGKRLFFCNAHNISYPVNCLQCSIEESHKKYTEENSNDWIECQICSFRGGDLGTHITILHNMNSEEYRTKYNVRVLKSQSMCDSVKGNKNPGYRHGGKFSAFSDKFIYAETTNKQEIIDKAEQSRKDNNSHTTTLEYWLERTGGDKEEAQKLLSNRQATFSKEICIEKYGEEEGLSVWNNRQEMWQETLNDKTDEEIESINKKKSTKFNYRNLWKHELSDTGYLYLLEIKGGFYKIGVTTKSLYSRYKKSQIDSSDILINFESTINHCFQIEQLIKHEFTNNIISKSEQVEGFGWTETLKDVDINSVLEMINELSSDAIYTTKLFKGTFNLKYEENF